VFFDDHCGVCTLGSKIAKSKIGVEEEGIQKLSQVNDFNNNYACQVDPQKACNELAVLDKETNEVQYGWNGIKALIAFHKPKWRWAQWKWLQGVYQFIYKNIAYSRRTIAPVKITEKTCTPERHQFYSNTFYLFCVAFALLIQFVWFDGNVLILLLSVASFHIVEIAKAFLLYRSTNHRQSYINASAFAALLFQTVYLFIHWSSFFILFYLLGLVLLSVLSVIWMKERLYFSKKQWLLSLVWWITYIVIQLYLLDNSFSYPSI
jgi:hypothetical protein